MAARIAFSTHFPDRMGELAGKPTRFPEKLITMIDPYGENDVLNDLVYTLSKDDVYNFNFRPNYLPKTTTIRSNYDYWKSKEGKLLQPFFWAGKPYRSKQVVFCPEVRLVRVDKIHITKYVYFPDIDLGAISPYEERRLIENEGFDHPDHFWRWFDQDFEGALLEFKAVEG